MDGKEANQLLMQIQGRAGVGKSFFLDCVERYIQKKKLMPGFLKTCAPTGTAAFNISGTTLHALLQLPVPMNPLDPAKALSGDQLKRLQFELSNTKLLVVDEKSMVSTVMMHQLDQRLREARPEHASKPFGGISVVMMGDFAQVRCCCVWYF